MTEPLFPKALRGVPTPNGDSYDLLPPQIKAMHNVTDTLVATGKAEVTRDHGLLAHAIARLFRFPKEGRDIPVTVTFTRTKEGEALSRNFNGAVFTTSFYDAHIPGHLIEQFGPAWFLIECICTMQGIDMHIRKLWLWNIIPLPLCFAPSIKATERVENGDYRFDVDIGFPLIGRIVRYCGWLRIE